MYMATTLILCIVTFLGQTNAGAAIVYNTLPNSCELFSNSS